MKTLNLLRLGGGDTACVVPFLEALPGALGAWLEELQAEGMGLVAKVVFTMEERRGIWHVDNGGSQRHGAAGSRAVGV